MYSKTKPKPQKKAQRNKDIKKLYFQKLKDRNCF